jgi:dTDP-4-amino-4,6-dideoxygalactose transaminase
MLRNKLMNKQKAISVGDPVLGEAEKKAICDVIDSGWITMGDRVKLFEKKFADLHGVQDAVAVNSCTAGLHLCLTALGVGPGDEVLVPALTFVATVNAILYVGAKPVFTDIEDVQIPHISIEDAKKKCSNKIKAVIVMHYGGYLVDLRTWRTFADDYGIFLIEDAAHSPATGDVGRWGDASAFSFFTNKNMTTAEGGMVFARDNNTLERIRRMRSHGMTTGTIDRHRGHAYSYDVTMLGNNFRMDELRAAIGLVQLDNLLQWNEYRRKLSKVYRRRLQRVVPEVIIPFDDNQETAAHVMPILLPQEVNREKVMASLRQSCIQTSIHYPPVHLFSYYRERFPGWSLPLTEEFALRELTLPLHPTLNEIHVELIVDSLRKAIDSS